MTDALPQLDFFCLSCKLDSPVEGARSLSLSDHAYLEWITNSKSRRTQFLINQENNSLTSELIQTGRSVLARSPDAWEEAMLPIAGVKVQEVLGRRFSAELQIFELPRTAFFNLKLPSARVVIPEGSGFVGVTMISSGEIRIAGPRREVWKAGSAHAINHDEYGLEFTSDKSLDCTAVCFQEPLLQEYAHKYNGPDASHAVNFGADLILDSDAGGCFSRYAMFVWNELNRGGPFLPSPIATEQIEDSLWSLLLSAVQREHHDRGHLHSGGYATYVKPAEEFILGHLEMPLRVVDIAVAVGVSVPTLNRAFRKCHGMGPKAFVKQRRLDRARSELLSADPQVSTVTAIATKYAFWHLSQFAAAYKKAFHEAPSDTLRRRPR